MVDLVTFIEAELGGQLLNPAAVAGMGNPMPPMDGHDGSEPMVFNKKAAKDRKKHEKNKRTMEKEGIGTRCNEVRLRDYKGSVTKREYNYHPKTKKELGALVKQLIHERGLDADLNDIDVSDITDMEGMFAYSKFNGDISQWDVSNVTDMTYMFHNSKFNGDISQWDVSNVKDMSYMFAYSDFNGDISQWDVSNVEDMSYMFSRSKFNRNLDSWKPDPKCKMTHTFSSSPLEKNPPKWYHE